MIPSAHLSPIHRSSSPTAFTVVAWGLLALWVMAWLFGPNWFSLLNLPLNPHGHAPLHAHGHPFVDARSWWGVPNTLDVLSNLPLVLAGAAGALALVLVVWATTRESAPGAIGVSLIALVVLYALAKLLELGDEAVFHATGHGVSGHSLKHVAAACAALPILVGLRRCPLGDNAPVHPAAMG